MYACFRGHVECVKVLLDHEANIEAVDNAGCTSLLGACLEGHVECVNVLLDHEAKI